MGWFKKSGRERRQHERYPIPVSLYYESGDRVRQMTTKDVSLGGAFVLIAEPLPIGTELILFLDVAKAKGELAIDPGTLVRVVRHAAGGMGVMFVEPPPDFLDVLRNEIARCKLAPV